jgi:hypothetical protein
MLIRSFRAEGSALAMSLGVTAMLAVLGVVALSAVQRHYRHSHQVAGWEEALTVAEGGVDLAVSELRRTLYDPANAFKSWAQPVAADQTAVKDLVDGAVFSTTYLPDRTTEGGTNARASVTIDAPPFLIDSRGEQWYRVRVTGYADVPGGSVVANNKEDRALRKIDFKRDRDTQTALTSARAKRSVEAIVKPIGAFPQALRAEVSINMNNHNIVVDSYDSRDSRYSTNGEYDPAKRLKNGDIATNGKLIDAGSAHIYGDASTNGGTVLNAGNVSGEIFNDFYQESFAVRAPNVIPDAGTPTYINGTATINARAGYPSNYQLSSISLSSSNTLTIAGAPDGSPTYVQIIVTGDISLTGQAQVILGKGVKARIFVAGNAKISGGGILNPNSPLHFQLYGLDRPKNADGSFTPGNIELSGNGGFKGTVYAPNYLVEMVGGGNADSVFGAFVGHDIRMTGVQSVHYDEALREGGLISDYRVVSWFEDVKH